MPCAVVRRRFALVLGLLAAAPLPAAGAELRVAVLEFDNAGPAEFEGLGKGLQSMITTDLAAVSALRLVERARLGEVLAEQKLGKSGAVDPKTAARIGKLAGATHLLAGSYTVVGGKMRLDSRLFVVQSGDVVLGEKIEGDKDAFFELEKALVQKLIAAVGVKVEAKERAVVSRVHTADFEAFRKFSLGVKYYDDKQYEKATAALREATQRDADFKLAALTLDEYQRLISQLQTKTEDLFAAQRSLEAAKRNQETAFAAGLLEKLWAVAERQGAHDREARLAALYNLAVILANLGRNQGKLMQLKQVEDRFALVRSGDVAARRYFAEAQGLFPKTLPLTFDDDFFNQGLLDPKSKFDEELADAVKRLFQKGENDENRKNRLVDATRSVHQTALLLGLDERQRVAFHERLFQGSLTLGPGDYHLREQREALAKEWRAVLELDKSTAYFTELTRGVDNPYALKGLTQEIQRNRDLTLLLGSGANRELLREYVLLSECGGQCSAKQLFGGDGKPEPRAYETLAGKRKLGGPERFTWIGDQQVWALQSPFFLWTGPRTDERRARDLRYYRAKIGNDPDPIVITGGGPRRAFDLRLHLAYALPEDFAIRGEPVAGRPEVALLFGAVDLDCAKQRDPGGGKDLLARPMKGLALLLGGGRARLVQLTEAERGMWDRKQRFDEQELQSQPLDLGERAEVQLQLRGSRLELRAGKQSLRFDLPAAADGFTGLLFRGLGFVAVEDPRFGSTPTSGAK